MAETTDEFRDDWIHGMFGAFREEAISIAADFGSRVKREIDIVADTQGIRPPSATALLTSVAVESTNIALSPFVPDDDEPQGESTPQSPVDDDEEGDE